MPGGIDVHTHLEMPFGGTFSSDDFETGTRAAAWGGTTTIVDFPVQKKGGTLTETLDTWHGKASGKASIDYGFHMIVSDVNDQTLKEMDALVGEGVTSFKMFMAYPGVFYATDDEILRAMQTAAGNGATIMMHAENGIAIDELVRRGAGRRRTPTRAGTGAPGRRTSKVRPRRARSGWPRSRARRCTSCTCRRGTPWTRSPRPATAARRVFAETCPQYLYLSQDDLDAPGFEGAKYVASPPVRTRSTGRTSGAGLRSNDLSVVSTDHCPFCFKEQKELGRGDFSKIPNGIPGIEHRIDLLHQGVVDGELSPARWVEVNSTTPARMFGLYPRKGTIAPGSDADIVLYDPAARHVLSASTHHMAVDYSAYEGREVQGQVKTVMSRGEIILDNGEWRGQAGRGKFLPRGTCQYLG